MKLEYKILWYEDEGEYIELAKEKIEEKIIKHKLIPVIHRGDESKDIVKELNKERYDLILMDYKLETTDGAKLIESIRQGQIYTDVIFYSGNEDAFQLNLEGVFYCGKNREVLVDKIEYLIQKNLKRVLEVSNLRGIVMEVTSDFDSKMKDIILEIWKRLDEEERKGVLKYLKEELLFKAKQNQIEKYEEYMKEEKTITEILDNDDHIMDSNKIATLLTQMLEIDKIREANQVVNQFEINNGHKKAKGFWIRYKTDILDYRNCLAHAKKESSDGEDIYIGKINEKSITFNSELCEQMREKLIKYENLLDELYNMLEDLN